MRLLLFALFIVLISQQGLSAEPQNTATTKLCGVKEILPLPIIKLEIAVKELKDPVHITNAGDGSKRLFIVEQAGVVRILKDGKLLPVPFFDIKKKVKSGGEMGLLSIAFHPEFAENGRFFVNYTSPKGGLHTVISEFQISKNPDIADKKSERVILTVDQPFTNHNGGQIAFGPDGYLYIGMGDGGSANDPHGHSQNLPTLLGAMLRIDVDRKGAGLEYGIPDDNPFTTRADARPEIWAYGVRNPWRFSFDPLTGVLYAGDVGQDNREEIDIIERGKNYGWNIMEGSICTPGVNPKCDMTGLTLPIADYGRDEGISVIGGFVYRGQEIPPLCGAYLYGDWGSGKIWSLHHTTPRVMENKLLLDTKFAISSFGVDEDYEVYVVDYAGSVYKIRQKQ